MKTVRSGFHVRGLICCEGSQEVHENMVLNGILVKSKLGEVSDFCGPVTIAL